MIPGLGRSEVVIIYHPRYMCTQVLEKNMGKKNQWKSPAFPFRLPGLPRLPDQVDRLLTAAGRRGSLAQGPRFHGDVTPEISDGVTSNKWMDDPHFGARKWMDHWIGLRENLQEIPWFLPANIGFFCKFSHHPILWMDEIW